MKKLLFLVFVITIGLQLKVKAQTVNIDSLWRVFETTKNDSLKLVAITQLYVIYSSSSSDSAYFFSKKLLKVCNQQNIPRYNSLAILYSSVVFFRTRNDEKVQERISKASIIAEKIQDEEVLARIENFKTFIETDPNKNIDHLRKAIQYKKALLNADQQGIILLGNLSRTFLKIHQTDSAFFYAQKMYEMSLRITEKVSSYMTSTMGNVYLEMNQPIIAYGYFKKGLDLAGNSKGVRSLQWAYIPMANYFEKTNQLDSALIYWKKPFEFGTKEAYKEAFVTSRKIYQYYIAKDQKDSALKYINFYVSANDSINNIEKVAKLQAAKFADELRKQEVEKAQQEETANRNHNLQLAFIAIGILSIIIIFLLLSNSFIVSHKLVGFLSVLVLLVVFEFINLLIHPFLEKVTHHSPLLMLLGLVAIASLIIPLHHKLEHWATHKLVEKNKAIRLKNAKKTIQELEGINT